MDQRAHLNQKVRFGEIVEVERRKINELGFPQPVNMALVSVRFIGLYLVENTSVSVETVHSCANAPAGPSIHNRQVRYRLVILLDDSAPSIPHTYLIDNRLR